MILKGEKMRENDEEARTGASLRERDAMTETMTENSEITAEDYWKKPEQRNGEVITDPSIGIWSRSRALRLIVWIVTIIAVIFLSLLASAYLSGFDSMFEMISWLCDSLLKS
jgi:hypothetical protein